MSGHIKPLLPVKLISRYAKDEIEPVYETYDFVLKNLDCRKLTHKSALEVLHILASMGSWSGKNAKQRGSKVISNIKTMHGKGLRFKSASIKKLEDVINNNGYDGKFCGFASGVYRGVSHPVQFLKFLRDANDLKSINSKNAAMLKLKYSALDSFKQSSSKMSQFLHLANPNLFVIVNAQTSKIINGALQRNLCNIDTYMDKLYLLFCWGSSLVGYHQRYKMAVLDDIIRKHSSKKNMEIFASAVNKLYEDPVSAIEGAEKMRIHLARERNSRIVAEFKKHLPNLNCEVCGFNFRDKYGDIGAGFIEAHHTRPLSAGKRKTSVDDFVAVCSNCHRMLHHPAISCDVDTLQTIVNKHS